MNSALRDKLAAASKEKAELCARKRFVSEKKRRSLEKEHKRRKASVLVTLVSEPEA